MISRSPPQGTARRRHRRGGPFASAESGLAFVLALSGAGACHTYVPATLESVPEGAAVRALLSTEAQTRLHQRSGMDLRELHGTLIRKASDRLLFEVRVPEAADAYTGRPLYQRLDVTPADVLRLDRRQVDGVRTGLMIGAAAGAAALLTVLALGDQNPGDPPNGATPPEEHRVGVLLLRP